MKKAFSIILLLWCNFSLVYGQFTQAVYQPEDSVKIEQMLQKAAQQPAKTNIVLYFAHQFLDKPYVAATLEVADPEKLVINLNELDCTTFVETVTALTVTFRHGGRTFGDYLSWLKRLRYRDGQLKDYTSRLHYYSSWILNAEKYGYVEEIGQKNPSKKSPFSGQQTLDIYFMTKNPQYYKALTNHPDFIPAIREAEKELTGRKVRYIPTDLLAGNRKQLRSVHDGDIVALVTKRGGLDVSHLGFAEWGKDGKLHLLNASSVHHKVTLETKNMYDYLKPQRLQTGIRVIRIK